MNHELSSVSILSLLDTTKAQRRSFAADVLDKIKNGHISSLKVHCQIKAMESLIKQFTDEKEGGAITQEYKALVLDEAQRHGKQFDYHNGKFAIKEAGHKYDWSQCGDPDLLSDMQELEELDAKIKARQDFLKTVPASGLPVIDETTGEVTTLFPPSVRSTTTVSVTLK